MLVKTGNNCVRLWTLSTMFVLTACWTVEMMAANIAPIFGDGMVLQRDAPVPIWGSAAPGEEVVVTFAGQTKTCEGTKEATWKVVLDPMEASAEGRTLKVVFKSKLRSNNNEFKNVVVGEVWFCSGQSNMAWPLSRCEGAAAEIAKADDPLLRHNGRKWEACSPKTAGGFSGVAYFFGKELRRRLKVPVGLINRSVGGTPIEFWIPEKDLMANDYAKEMTKKCNTPQAMAMMKEYNQKMADYRKVLTVYQEARKNGDKNAVRPTYPRPEPLYANVAVYKKGFPGRLYKNLVKPVIPYAIRGAIWYQGERNSRLLGGPRVYRELLPVLIEGWRQAWGEGPFPFLFVQLPNYKNDKWPLLRESMVEALKTPKTGLVVSIDVGLKGNIHPPDKKSVGTRLAMLALADVYEGVEGGARCPLFKSMKVNGSELVITFKDAGDGLAIKSDEGGSGFLIAGEDEVFHPADASVKGDAVTLRSEKVAKPVAARYAWAANPTATLFNSAGLPASPFRTDDWKVEE